MQQEQVRTLGNAMEMKKNSTSAQDSEPTYFSLIDKIDEEEGIEVEKSENQAGIEHNGMKPRVSSLANDNAATESEQQQPCGASPPAGLPPVRPQVHQPLQLPPGFVAPNVAAFWPNPRAGYQSIPQVGLMGNSSCQVSGGGPLQVIAARSVGQIPGVCYQYGLPYPAYTAARPCVLPFAGACNYITSSAPQSTAISSGASLGSSQKGVIRPSAEISQEHRVLWEAQSAENVQLWAVIARLQSELADVRGRLVKLETEANSVKPSGQQLEANSVKPSAGQQLEANSVNPSGKHLETPDTGLGLVKQKTKRGRPRKCGPLVYALPSSDVHLHHPRPRGRRPFMEKGPPAIKEISLRKDIQNTLESTMVFSPITTLQPGYRESETDCQIIQTSEIGLISALEKKSADHELTEKFKQVPVQRSSGPFGGRFPSAKYGILSNSHSDRGGEIICETPQTLYTPDNQSGPESRGVTPWSLVNEEENGSEELDEETTESDKQQDEEMENAISMGTEAISGAKNDEMEPYKADTLQQNPGPPGFPLW